jgi:hypothetical protein
MLRAESIAQVADQVVPVEEVGGVGQVAVAEVLDPLDAVGDQEDLAGMKDAASLELGPQTLAEHDSRTDDWILTEIGGPIDGRTGGRETCG